MSSDPNPDPDSDSFPIELPDALLCSTCFEVDFVSLDEPQRDRQPVHIVMA